MKKKKTQEVRPPRSGIDETFLAIACAITGLILGVIRAWTEGPGPAEGGVLQKICLFLDLNHMMKGLSLWLLIGLSITVFARGPWRGGIRMGCFYLGALVGVIVYRLGVNGNYPGLSELYLAGIVLISVPLGVLGWYSRRQGVLGCVLTALILAILLTQTFSWGFWYIKLKSIQELVILVLAAIVLFRPTRTYWFALGGAIAGALILRAGYELINKTGFRVSDLVK